MSKSPDDFGVSQFGDDCEESSVFTVFYVNLPITTVAVRIPKIVQYYIILREQYGFNRKIGYVRTPLY